MLNKELIIIALHHSNSTCIIRAYASVVKRCSFSGHLWRQYSGGRVGWRRYHRAIGVHHVPCFSIRRQQYTWSQTAFAMSAVKRIGSRGQKQRVSPAVHLLTHAFLVIAVVVFWMHTPAEAEDATFAVPTCAEDWALKTQGGLRRKTNLTNTLPNKLRHSRT